MTYNFIWLWLLLFVVAALITAFIIAFITIKDHPYNDL